jgi:hypothetical protein
VLRPKSETDIEQADRDRAKAAGWKVYKLVCVGQKGFPDRLYVRKGVSILMEWKKPDSGVLSESQVRRQTELRAEGMLVYVVDSLEQADAIRRRHLSR